MTYTIHWCPQDDNDKDKDKDKDKDEDKDKDDDKDDDKDNNKDDGDFKFPTEGHRKEQKFIKIMKT